jgi:23S rRNA pseudouridine1911/1915/1917 synthase
MEEQIVYEDNHLLVINKKVGQLVQGDKTGDDSLLELIKDFIKKR